MGVGGGLFSNLLMTFYGRPIHQAVATSSALAVLISIPGAIGYVYAGWPAAARYPDITALQLPFAIGYVSLIGAVLVMPTSLLTAPLGVRAAHAMSKRTLEMAFGCYLFIVGSQVCDQFAVTSPFSPCGRRWRGRDGCHHLEFGDRLGGVEALRAGLGAFMMVWQR